MNKIVECVPNFSEGKDRRIIDAIAAAISGTDGCTLLDVDAGATTNRTVYTFVGDPQSVAEGAFNAAAIAKAKIDMRRHSGAHPRFGAMDVCPFIPVANVTMAECIAVAERFGQRLGQELNVPVFLYEHASRHDHRRKLDDIRKGEYEALAGRIIKDPWKPDFGPSKFVARWGATAVGARQFLIAYNINLIGTVNQAHRIAFNIREAGRGPDAPGRLATVKAMGWYLDEHNLAQVTANLCDYTVAGLHTVFEAVRQDAAELKIGVAGSEIVGLVPLDAILAAAEHYIEKETLFVLDEDQKIRLAIERLGLNSISPFDPAERIIDYVVAEPLDAPLVSLSTRGLIEAVAARTGAPGGGSVSALVSALGAALGAMVTKLTYGVRRFEAQDATMRAIIPQLEHAVQALIPIIDQDARAYEAFVSAHRMPAETPAQEKARQAAIESALETAIAMPMRTMEIADRAWDALLEAARSVNIASASDIQVGARCLETGIWGALQNIRINAAALKDEDHRKRIEHEADQLAQRATRQCNALLDIIAQRQSAPQSH